MASEKRSDEENSSAEMGDKRAKGARSKEAGKGKEWKGRNA